jgi:hypothetical protein
VRCRRRIWTGTRRAGHPPPRPSAPMPGRRLVRIRRRQQVAVLDAFECGREEARRGCKVARTKVTPAIGARDAGARVVTRTSAPHAHHVHGGCNARRAATWPVLPITSMLERGTYGKGVSSPLLLPARLLPTPPQAAEAPPPGGRAKPTARPQCGDRDRRVYCRQRLEQPRARAANGNFARRG